MRTLVSEIDIAALIPHSGSMCLLDRVVEYDETQIHCRTGSHRDAANPLAVAGRLDTIAGAERLTALVMGTNDLAKETGAQPGRDRLPFVGALGLAVAAARLHGRVILDGVFNGIDDDEGFSAQARQAVEFGFDGKTLIHPRQIDPCNAAFLPDAAELAWSRQIIEAFDRPENQQKGAIRVDGKMVERLHLHQAHRVIAAALQPG